MSPLQQVPQERENENAKKHAVSDVPNNIHTYIHTVVDDWDAANHHVCPRSRALTVLGACVCLCLCLCPLFAACGDPPLWRLPSSQPTFFRRPWIAFVGPQMPDVLLQARCQQERR